jgi:hypothetical protein
VTAGTLRRGVRIVLALQAAAGFSDFLVADMKKWADVVKKSGARVE